MWVWDWRLDLNQVLLASTGGAQDPASSCTSKLKPRCRQSSDYQFGPWTKLDLEPTPVQSLFPDDNQLIIRISDGGVTGPQEPGHIKIAYAFQLIETQGFYSFLRSPSTRTYNTLFAAQLSGVHSFYSSPEPTAAQSWGTHAPESLKPCVLPSWMGDMVFSGPHKNWKKASWPWDPQVLGMSEYHVCSPAAHAVFRSLGCSENKIWELLSDVRVTACPTSSGD